MFRISNKSANEVFKMSSTTKEMESDLLKHVSNLNRQLDQTTVKMSLIKSQSAIDLNIGKKLLHTNL